MEEFDSAAVKAVLFDVYGTLVEMRDKRAPFRQLIQIGARQGRKPSNKDAAVIMSQPVGLREAAGLLGIHLSDADHERLDGDLRAEIESIAPFADTLSVLWKLKSRGFKLGLCSNLALDYAAPIETLLPFALDAHVWSFDTAAIKPDPAIYAEACRRLNCLPGEVLMIGDTPEADVAGPRAFGMQAVLLDRKQRSGARIALPSLSALCGIIAA